MTVLTREYLRECFDYDPVTGALVWKRRPESHFATKRAAAIWNSRQAGTPAGQIGADGYRYVKIGNKSFSAHRVIWLYAHGEWPKGNIDHEGGDRDDNRLGCLRDVPHVLNQRNQKRPVTNTSGVVGVYRGTYKWRAEIQVDGRKVHLGMFDDIASAAEARRIAERRHGFHENHGRAA